MFPAAGIVTVSGGMEGLCRGYRRLAGSAWCGFRRQTGHLNAAGGRHRCGSSCATGAGRTAPAAGNGTEYRCTPAQGVRRGPKAVPGQFSSGIHQYKTAALPAPEYFPLHHTFSCPGTGSPEPTRYRPRGGMRPHNSKTEKIVYTNTDTITKVNYCTG